jgi:hypothetical protein
LSFGAEPICRALPEHGWPIATSAYQAAVRQPPWSLALRHVLRHIVEAVRELVNARYAAMGVVAGGRLVRFLHTGMSAEVVAAIGYRQRERVG